MEHRQSKNSRVLDLYQRLCEGRVIVKAEEAQRSGVDERSVQRDIDDIRTYLHDRVLLGTGDGREVIYDRQQKGFRLASYQAPLMSNSEILAVSKILLESRAFTKDEMFTILDKLVAGCVPQKNMKLVTELLANEKFHYTELAHPAGIQEKLWDIGSDIQKRNLLALHYQRQDTTQPPVERIVEPVSILFSEYYFYLNAYIVEPNEEGRYLHKYDYPAIFRLDRIEDYRLLGEKFMLPYADRFQEGEFRKRVQFMYPGRLQKVRFRYSGSSVESVLDRLPTASVVSADSGGCIVEAEVYGKGVLMWLLSQGERVEVLGPQELRDEMRDTLERMLAKYQESV